MASKKTKKQFLARQKRKGRTRAQAEATWKMMQAQKKAMEPYYALNPERDAPRSVRITYEIITPESAEYGDAEERGWIDEDGESMEPGEYYDDTGGTAVDNAVGYLLQHGTWLEPSETGNRPPYAARWWTDYEHSEDFRTGARESRSYHLYGFSDAELKSIYEKYTDAAKRGLSATAWEWEVQEELEPNRSRKARRNPPRRRKGMAYAKRNPDDWVSYTYGQLPTKRVFMRQYKETSEGGLGAPFGMLLRDRDEFEAVEGTPFEAAIDSQAYFDADEVWEGVKQLVEKWEEGDEAAGDLVSSIFYTLNIEWI